MTSQIIISINDGLEQKRYSLFNTNSAKRMLNYGETFPYEIEVTNLKQMLPANAQIGL